MRLSEQVSRLAVQESAFRGLASVLDTLTERLSNVREQLQKLNIEREARKWKIVWIALASIAGVQITSLVMLLLLYFRG